MKQYLGVKLVKATPMTGKEYYDRYNISVKTGPGFLVVYEDGYTSWSPKDVFEKAYRLTDNLTFGLALEALKLGNKVARASWPAGTYIQVLSNNSLNSNSNNLLGFYNSDGPVSHWTHSVGDLFAEDYILLS